MFFCHIHKRTINTKNGQDETKRSRIHGLRRCGHRRQLCDSSNAFLLLSERARGCGGAPSAPNSGRPLPLALLQYNVVKAYYLR